MSKGLTNGAGENGTDLVVGKVTVTTANASSVQIPNPTHLSTEDIASIIFSTYANYSEWYIASSGKENRIISLSAYYDTLADPPFMQYGLCYGASPYAIVSGDQAYAASNLRADTSVSNDSITINTTFLTQQLATDYLAYPETGVEYNYVITPQTVFKS